MLGMLFNYFLLLLQESLPALYEQFFNEKTKLEIVAVIGSVTLLRNGLEEVIDIDGWKGLLLTSIVSLLYGLFQYGLGADGVGYGLVIGGLAAVTFFWGKNFGKVLGTLFGAKNFSPISDGTQRIAAKIENGENIVKVIVQVLKFLLIRK